MNIFSTFRVAQAAAMIFVFMFAASAQQASDKDNHGIVAADMTAQSSPETISSNTVTAPG